MKDVPITILQHLGGKKFVAMTGAKYFVGDKNSLKFQLPRGLKIKARFCEIKLNPLDLYDMTFYNVSPEYVRVVIAKQNDIYSDQLCDIFESETGLYTSL